MNTNVQVRALSYLKTFNAQLENCNDVYDYIELVNAILLFEKLVCAQFKELYSEDASNSEADLELTKMHSNAQNFANSLNKEFNFDIKGLN